MDRQAQVETASLADLDVLLDLEGVAFSSDRFTRNQYRYLLTRANASVFVIRERDHLRGAAVMLWREHGPMGRLYTIAIHPSHRGQGLGRVLLETCEQAALVRRCKLIALEVRADNKTAISLYMKHKYQVVGTLEGYYEDGCNALSMRKQLRRSDAASVMLDVPFFEQTTDFTCGSACLMMAMGYLDPKLKLDRALELMIWKDATLIFMNTGLGGCDSAGMALAARNRGYAVRTVIAQEGVPFLTQVKRSDKREIVKIIHEEMRRQAIAAGAEIEYHRYTLDDLINALNADMVPIVLISYYRLFREKAPHWVVVTGYADDHLFFHDPYVGYYEDKRKARSISMPVDEFWKIARFGKEFNWSVVFLGKKKREK